jgi:hypothetical protein
MDDFYAALKEFGLDDEQVEFIRTVFNEQKIMSQTLPRLTNESLREYGIKQGGLREAILAVLGK